uniref:Uncharacterized protein n=1 Tax=Amphimedon queenslandica TaxID=400682 RepID=A0A1X7T0H7_AMPQE
MIMYTFLTCKSSISIRTAVSIHCGVCTIS